MLFYLFSEFVSCQWTKKDKETRAPGIMRFITRFNHVTSIISYGVVHGITAEQRSKIIEFWIKTAAHCRDLNNFCLLYTSPSPRDKRQSRMPSSA